MQFNRLILTCAILFCSLTAFTQVDDASKYPGSFLSINAGAGLPIGNFKSTSYLGMGGYALNGWQCSVALTRYLSHRRLGYIFRFLYNMNNFNEYAYNQTLQSHGDMPVSYGWSNSYKAKSLLIGMVYSIPVNKLSITASLLAGPSYITLPDYVTPQYNANGPSDPLPLFIFQSYSPNATSISTNVGIMFNGGIAARYSFNDNVSISLSIDYLYNFTALQDPKGQATNSYTFGGYGNSGTPIGSISYNVTNDYYLVPFDIINISAGITYHLHK
ncbi:MAG TPA: hypothetical protein VK806_12955 [Bacteroidia bacterium]|jgi:hypothetical protein|nr:hypothetical protein [Bacteroidia bacterium]